MGANKKYHFTSAEAYRVALGDKPLLYAHPQGLTSGTGQFQLPEFLNSIGCEIIQGYLFSKPLFLADLENFVLAYQPLPGLGTTERWLA